MITLNCGGTALVAAVLMVRDRPCILGSARVATPCQALS